MRLTLRHTYDFGAEGGAVGDDLVRPEAWDAARDLAGPFALPATRMEWEARASSPELAARARGIAALTARLDAESVCSYGAGIGALELNLARLAPGLHLVCTDYAPRTVERLGALFREAEIVRHDLSRDDPLEADLHLLHRVDTELSDDEWRTVFPRFRTPALYVPAMLLTWRTAAKELARRVRLPQATRAGYVRTEDALRVLWRPSHRDERLAVGDLTGFLLIPR